MKEKKGFLLQTVKQMNAGAIVSGLGFLLYLALSALELETAADITAVAFGMVSVYVFASVAAGRSRNREAVSYSLLWGTGALALLLGGCGVLTIRMWLGLLKIKRRMTNDVRRFLCLAHAVFQMPHA